MVQQSNILREFIFIFFDRKILIFLVFITIVLITLVSLIFTPAVYKATAKFSVIIPQSMDPLQKENFYDFQNVIKQFMQNQKELIFSNRVLQKIVDSYVKVKGKNNKTAIDDIKNKLEVAPPDDPSFGSGSMFYINFIDESPKIAAEFAKLISLSYVEAYRDISKSKSDYSYDFFKIQVKKLNEDMVAKEKTLREYEKKQALALIEILNLESGKTNIEVGPNALLTQFTSKHNELQEEFIGLNTLIKNIENGIKTNKIPVMPQEMEINGQSITLLKRKVTELQIQYNEMKPQFEDKYEPMQRLKKELDLAIKSFKEELERTMQAKKIMALSLKAKIENIEDKIAELKKRIQSTAQERSVYEHLKDDYLIAKNAYTQTWNQLEQARLSQSLNQEKQHLYLMDEPVIPSKPFKPNKRLIFLMSIFTGFFLGLAAAVTIDYFDHSIKKIEDIERYLNVPMIGSFTKL